MKVYGKKEWLIADCYFDSNWVQYLHISDFICYVATFVSLLSGIIYLIDNKQVFGGNKNE